MNPDRWKIMQRIFHEALELPSAQRADYVRSASSGDAGLETEVLALIAQDESGNSALDDGIATLAHAVFEGKGDVPERIGPYRILTLLGEGGMGVVYKAKRDDLDLEVAIKFLRDARLSPQRRQRFLLEQKMLGRLSHPAICSLHDAGVLDDGTPYFVMEYADGLPLTQYCERYAVGLRERLRLFREVADAVAHAHRRMLIHRDLKPSNILAVRENRDGPAKIKLLDFGIAKQTMVEASQDANAGPAMQAEPATRTVFQMMTPAYAAPEQLLGHDPGAFTDVYSLGVVLYELLTSVLPFQLGDRSAAEAAEYLKAHAPMRPSVRAKDSHRAPAFVPSVSNRDWADLDVLCLSAMHADAERRYQSVDALIDDLDRFLNGQPLQARPDSLRYHLRKFVSRNKRAVAAAAIVVLTISGLLTFYTLRLSAARDEAIAEAARTQRVQQFTLNLFRGGDDVVGPRQGLDVMTLIERGVREAQALDGEPEIQEELYQTLGNVYRKMSELDRAESLIQTALDQRKRRLGPGHPDVAESMTALGLVASDRGDFDRAERLVRAALLIVEQELPARHPAIAATHEALGSILTRRGRYDDAFLHLRTAVAAREAAGDTNALMESLGSLANAHFYAGDYEESDRYNRRLLEMTRAALGENHPAYATCLINLAGSREWLGYPEEAEKLYREALVINLDYHGRAHPTVASNLSLLGAALLDQGKAEEARSLLQEALGVMEEVFGPDHSEVALVLNKLGRLDMAGGDLASAEIAFARELQIYRTTYGDQHVRTAAGWSNIASTQFRRGLYSEAEESMRRSVETFAAALKPDHVDLAIARTKLGQLLLRVKRYEEACKEFLAALTVLQSQANPQMSWIAVDREGLAEAYEALGDSELAATYRTAAVPENAEGQQAAEK